MSRHSYGASVVLDQEGLTGFFSVLHDRGYSIVAPTVRDGAIDWQVVETPDELPRGWTARQSPGACRLERRPDQAWFGYAAGPAGLKRFLHQPEARLFSVESNGSPFHILEDSGEIPARAFIGVRACDLAALARLDRVLLADRYPDPLYRRNRERTFLVAVSCTDPSASCFCASMGTGPEVEDGFDILLTETVGAQASRFVTRAGSDLGCEVLDRLELPPATDEDLREASGAVAAGRTRITRRLDVANLRESLAAHFEHPEWERVAARCLGCGNCTQVCPTCFCVTVEDTSGIDGRRAERWRKWDSCFTLSYSYIHGGSVRQSAKARYRQWATHKFAAWYDQFGTSGCTGCGRCITWCPAGIDVTEVVASIAGASREAAAQR